MCPSIIIGVYRLPRMGLLCVTYKSHNKVIELRSLLHFIASAILMRKLQAVYQYINACDILCTSTLCLARDLTTLNLNSSIFIKMNEFASTYACLSNPFCNYYH